MSDETTAIVKDLPKTKNSIREMTLTLKLIAKSAPVLASSWTEGSHRRFDGCSLKFVINQSHFPYGPTWESPSVHAKQISQGCIFGSSEAKV